MTINLFRFCMPYITQGTNGVKTVIDRSSKDDLPYITAHPSATYKFIFREVFYYPDNEPTFTVPAQTYTISAVNNIPVLFDSVFLDDTLFYLWLETAEGILDNLVLPPTSVFNLTLSKNNQSFTIENMQLTDPLSGPGYLNGYNIFDSNMSYLPENNSICFDFANAIIPETTQVQFESFKNSAEIVTIPDSTILYDPDLIITITIPEQNVIPVTFTDTVIADNITFDVNEFIPTWTAEVFGWSISYAQTVEVLSANITGISTEYFFRPNVEESASVTNLVTVNGKAVGLVSVNPTATEVLVNGQPLAAGSVLKNSTTGQKFMKVDGDSKAFIQIELVPKETWGWSEESEAGWEILQNL